MVAFLFKKSVTFFIFTFCDVTDLFFLFGHKNFSAKKGRFFCNQQPDVHNYVLNGCKTGAAGIWKPLYV